MLFSKYSLAAMATAAFALPTPQDSGTPSEFSFTLQAEGYSGLTLGAIYDGSTYDFPLVWEQPPDFPGTPAYLNDTYIDFKPGSGSTYYGMTFADVGDNYGVTVPVYAVMGAVGRDGFGFGSDNTLYARMDSAEEAFFACNTTINDEPALGLYWGVFNSNGSSPYGCTPATLIKNDCCQQ